MAPTTEPLVRIRCRSPEDEARCRRVLEAARLAPEPQLTWLVVRDADPDEVNELLVAGGALGRVAVRERIGQLLGWLIDRGGDFEGRVRNVRSLVERVLADGGLAQRYAPADEGALLAGARSLHEHLVETGAGFVPWGRFLELFCLPRR